ncbi:MAG: AAA family ATPase [Spirochaetaceae bacterium]|jgi:DNA sulfur modification protein DndD|nr:AAA family ATPase [Spirochaetaceae bacterium]
MIKTLRLLHFGKFTDRTFDFAPVTLFFGENEAGKTTLFDALFDALCAPKGEFGRRLKSRYGTDRSAELEFDGEALKLQGADFLNLLAVRSGTITLDIEKNSEWMNRVKAELFSGGINPQNAVTRLEEIIRSKARGTLNHEAAGIEAELAELRGELAGARTLREECLAAEERIAALDRQMAETARETGLLEEEIRSLEQSLAQQNLLREEKALRGLLFTIDEGRRQKEALENSARYTPERLEEFRRREEDGRRLKTETGIAAAAEEELARKYRRAAEAKEAGEAAKLRAEKFRLLADLLRETLVPREKLVDQKTRLAWKKIPLVFAALTFLLGAAGLFLADFIPLPYRYILPAAGLALALAFLFAAAGRRTWEDTDRLEVALGAARAKWRAETGEELPGGYEDLLAGLNRISERARFAAEDYGRILGEAAALGEEAAAAAARKREAERAHSAALGDLRVLFDSAGVSGIEDYAARLEKKKNLEVRWKETEAKLREGLRAYKAAAVTELESLLTAKIREIGDRLTEKELPPEDLRILENRLRDRKDRLTRLRREEKEGFGNFSRHLGEVRERFRGIPEEIAGCEKKISRGETRLGEIKRELRAAAIAADIFRSLFAGADTMLRDLSGEIGTTFSAFTAEKRLIEFRAYSAETAAITDAGGELREAEQLSAGTRDAFLLAARLVLARKSQTGGRRALIVLDEPFLALDRPRIGRALRLLGEFREATGWQLVFLTKDEGLEAQARDVFGPLLLVHHLR